MDGQMNVLLKGVVGSHAYGLNHAGSDIDTLGVFAASPRDFWRLRAPRQTFVQNEPDITMHEIGKFISLALKCNPTVLELLWLDEYVEQDSWGQRLVDIRRCFLSEPFVRGAFGGYAVQQARRLERRNAEGKEGFASDVKQRTAKHARHCFRLLRQGAELLASGDMTLKVSDPERLFELGEQSVPEIVAAFEDEYARFHSIISVLPQEPSRGFVERTLMRMREYYFHAGEANRLVSGHAAGAA